MLTRIKNGQSKKEQDIYSWFIYFRFSWQFTYSPLTEIKKSPKFQWVPKTNKIMTHLHLMRTQKHKMLSIVVLNMAKYTIISLISTA